MQHMASRFPGQKMQPRVGIMVAFVQESPLYNTLNPTPCTVVLLIFPFLFFHFSFPFIFSHRFTGFFLNLKRRSLAYFVYGRGGQVPIQNGYFAVTGPTGNQRTNAQNMELKSAITLVSQRSNRRTKHHGEMAWPSSLIQRLSKHVGIDASR